MTEFYYPKSFLDVPANQCTQMSEEDTRAFIGACMRENSVGVERFNLDDPQHLEISRSSHGFLMMHTRLPKRVQVSLCTLLFLACTIDRPGVAVQWAYALTRMYDRKGGVINVQDLADAFPNGFPTEEAKSEIWDDQKGSRHKMETPFGGNILDMKEAWDPLP